MSHQALRLLLSVSTLCVVALLAVDRSSGGDDCMGGTRVVAVPGASQAHAGTDPAELPNPVMLDALHAHYRSCNCATQNATNRDLDWGTALQLSSAAGNVMILLDHSHGGHLIPPPSCMHACNTRTNTPQAAPASCPDARRESTLAPHHARRPPETYPGPPTATQTRSSHPAHPHRWLPEARQRRALSAGHWPVDPGLLTEHRQGVWVPMGRLWSDTHAPPDRPDNPIHNHPPRRAPPHSGYLLTSCLSPAVSCGSRQAKFPKPSLATVARPAMQPPRNSNNRSSARARGHTVSVAHAGPTFMLAAQRAKAAAVCSPMSVIATAVKEEERCQPAPNGGKDDLPQVLDGIRLYAKHGFTQIMAPGGCMHAGSHAWPPLARALCTCARQPQLARQAAHRPNESVTPAGPTRRPPRAVLGMTGLELSNIVLEGVAATTSPGDHGYSEKQMVEWTVKLIRNATTSSDTLRAGPPSALIKAFDVAPYGLPDKRQAWRVTIRPTYNNPRDISITAAIIIAVATDPSIRLPCWDMGDKSATLINARPRLVLPDRVSQSSNTLSMPVNVCVVYDTSRLHSNATPRDTVMAILADAGAAALDAPDAAETQLLNILDAQASNGEPKTRAHGGCSVLAQCGARRGSALLPTQTASPEQPCVGSTQNVPLVVQTTASGRVTHGPQPSPALTMAPSDGVPCYHEPTPCPTQAADGRQGMRLGTWVRMNFKACGSVIETWKAAGRTTITVGNTPDDGAQLIVAPVSSTPANLDYAVTLHSVAGSSIDNADHLCLLVKRTVALTTSKTLTIADKNHSASLLPPVALRNFVTGDNTLADAITPDNVRDHVGNIYSGQAMSISDTSRNNDPAAPNKIILSFSEPMHSLAFLAAMAESVERPANGLCDSQGRYVLVSLHDNHAASKTTNPSLGHRATADARGAQSAATNQMWHVAHVAAALHAGANHAQAAAFIKQNDLETKGTLRTLVRSITLLRARETTTTSNDSILNLLDSPPKLSGASESSGGAAAGSGGPAAGSVGRAAGSSGAAAVDNGSAASSSGAAAAPNGQAVGSGGVTAGNGSAASSSGTIDATSITAPFQLEGLMPLTEGLRAFAASDAGREFANDGRSRHPPSGPTSSSHGPTEERGGAGRGRSNSTGRGHGGPAGRGGRNNSQPGRGDPNAHRRSNAAHPEQTGRGHGLPAGPSYNNHAGRAGATAPRHAPTAATIVNPVYSAGTTPALLDDPTALERRAPNRELLSALNQAQVTDVGGWVWSCPECLTPELTPECLSPELIPECFVTGLSDPAHALGALLCLPPAANVTSRTLPPAARATWERCPWTATGPSTKRGDGPHRTSRPRDPEPLGTRSNTAAPATTVNDDRQGDNGKGRDRPSHSLCTQLPGEQPSFPCYVPVRPHGLHALCTRPTTGVTATTSCWFASAGDCVNRPASNWSASGPGSLCLNETHERCASMCSGPWGCCLIEALARHASTWLAPRTQSLKENFHFSVWAAVMTTWRNTHIPAHHMLQQAAAAALPFMRRRGRKLAHRERLIAKLYHMVWVLRIPNAIVTQVKRRIHRQSLRTPREIHPGPREHAHINTTLAPQSTIRTIGDTPSPGQPSKLTAPCLVRRPSVPPTLPHTPPLTRRFQRLEATTTPAPNHSHPVASHETPHATPIARGGSPDGWHKVSRTTRRTKTAGVTQSATALPFHERQRDQNCQVHAINNTVGYPLIDRWHVLSHAERLNNGLIRRSNGAQRLDRGGYYTAGTGNFDTAIINHYLTRNGTHDYGFYIKSLTSSLEPYSPGPTPLLPRRSASWARIHRLTALVASSDESYTHGILPGSTQAQVLARLPPGATSAILHYTKVHAPHGLPYGHASCIRQWEGRWWHIDSEETSPQLLTDGDDNPQSRPPTLNWGMLYGKVRVIEAGPPPDRTIPVQLLEADGSVPLGFEYGSPSNPHRSPAEPPSKGRPEPMQEMEQPEYGPAPERVGPLDVTSPCPATCPPPTTAPQPTEWVGKQPQPRAPTANQTTLPPTGPYATTHRASALPDALAVRDATRGAPARLRPAKTTDTKRLSRGPKQKVKGMRSLTELWRPVPRHEEAPRDAEQKPQSTVTHPPTMGPSHARPLPTSPPFEPGNPIPTTTLPNPPDPQPNATNRAALSLKPKRAPRTTQTTLWMRPNDRSGPPGTPSPAAPSGEEEPGSPAPALPYLTIMTSNVKGLRSHDDIVQEGIKLHMPHFFVLSETKLTPETHHNRVGQRIRQSLPGYRLYMSSKPAAVSDTGRRTPQAGVVMGVTSSIAASCDAHIVQTPSDLRGHVCHITLSPHGRSQAHLLGVYMPEDMPLRKRVYEYMGRVSGVAKANGHQLLAAGDWNATLIPSDRPSGSDPYAADLLHHRTLESLGLFPLAGAAPDRPHTYHRLEPSYSSRIDDVLIMRSASAPHPGQAQETTDDLGGTLDHKALIIKCSLTPFMEPHHAEPQTHAPNSETKGSRFPISAASIAATKASIEAKLSLGIYTVRAHIMAERDRLVGALNGNHTAANVRGTCERLAAQGSAPDIEAMASSLGQNLSKALTIMEATCDQQTPSCPRACFPRKAGRTFTKLLAKTRALKRLHAATDPLVPGRWATQGGADDPHELANEMGIHDLYAQGTRERIRDCLKQTQARMDLMRKEKAKRQQEAARSAFQRRLATNAKQTNRSMFREALHDPSIPPLSGIRDPATNKVHTNPETMLTLCSRFYEKLFCPTHVTKTGRYLPAERGPSFSYPWEQQGAPDRFSLSSTHWNEMVMGEGTGPASPEGADILELIMDRCTYEQVLGHTSKGKQPGPDRIPNELLKCLPDEWHDTIHALFTILWITGRTPHAWKESTTTLLHKKGDTYSLPNYRPIGLSNALYKLWTSTVNFAVMHHALRFNILHRSQEGGIIGRNSPRHIRNLLNAFEDAYHCKQDLFALYIDFSSAFNMVDHDKLMCVMYDLGIPTDAIEVVKGIYHENRTTVKLPSGATEPIPITRGTVQGDPLSPLLFLLYIEPLLRWLHVGGRGYKFGCLGESLDPTSHIPLKLKDQFACNGLIDDTACLTNTREDLTVQGSKVDAFCDWAGTPANATKCATTAILHKWADSPRSSRDPMDPERLASLLDHGHAVRIAGKPIPYLSPTTPYPYLGVMCCPAMLSSPQLQKSMEEARKMGDKLAASYASPRQCLLTIGRSIKPKVAYPFCAGLYTNQDIAALDKCLAGIARKCLRLPQGTPTSAILRDTSEGGWGLGSLAIDYATISAAGLTRAISDHERLGTTTRALLNLQRARMGGAPVEDLDEHQARYCSLLRHLAVANQHGFSLIDHGEEVTQTPDGEAPLPIWAQLSTLLKAKTVKSNLLLTLTSLGIRHLGQLVDENGKHIITTDDLARLYGGRDRKSVSKWHKLNLNKISVAVSGCLPPGKQKISEIRSCASLPATCRALPPGLSLEMQLNRPRDVRPLATAGTYDIRHLFERAAAQAREPIPRQDNRFPPPPPITRDWRDGKERQVVKVGADHLPPSQVSPTDPASSQLFWQQRCETWGPGTRQFTGPFAAHLRTLGLGQRCTWEEFRLEALKSDCIPAGLVSSLYDEQFNINGVEGIQRFTRKNGSNALQYLVTWEPMLMVRAHYSAAAAAYGESGTLTPVSATDPTSVQTLDQRVPFLAIDGAYTHLDIVEVQWAPCHQDAATLRAGYPDSFPNLLTAFERRDRAPRRRAMPAAAAPPPYDEGMGLTEHARQGMHAIGGPHPVRALPWETTRKIRRHCHLDPVERNPDQDILPPGAYTIQIGKRQGQPGAPSTETTRVDTGFVYRPDGRCVGTLSVDRLSDLQRQYTATGEHDPDMHRSLGATTFPQDLAQLLLRYKMGQRRKDASQHPSNDPRNRWACPERLMQALAQGLQAKGERFASPLDRNLHMAQLWSRHPEDQLFGANHDAYSTIWTGCSQAHPGMDPGEVEKSVRWAIHSALACPDTPTCTILVIPYRPNLPHAKYMAHPSIKLLSVIEEKGESEHCKLQHPDSWRGRPSDQQAGESTPDWPKTDMLIAAVSNEIGREQFLKPAHLSAFYDTWGVVATAWRPRGCKPQTSNDLARLLKLPPLAPHIKPPRALARLLESAAMANGPPTRSCIARPIGPVDAPAIALQFPCTQPLALDPDILTVYTDGSCLKPKDQPQQIGAGIVCHRPALRRVDGALVADTRRCTFLVNPEGKGCTKTVNRAELAAISQALSNAEVAGDDEPLYLYTDSLCSIHMIRRVLDAPWTLTECKHYLLLQGIVEALIRRAEKGAHTHIHKVKSHVGNTGNEAADRAAREAAELPHRCHLTENAENNPYMHRPWVAHPLAQPESQDPPREPADDDAPRRFVSSLSKGVKKIAKAVASAGQFAQTGVYAQAWTAALPTLDRASCGGMFTDPGITWRQVTLTMKARWGQLWNRKLAFRYKMAKSPACPLCGEPDSTGHLLGGCNHKMSQALRVARHDGAVKILHGVLQKRMGAWATFMDAGTQADLPASVQGKRLPAWLLPEELITAAERRKLRPDMLIIEGLIVYAEDLEDEQSMHELRASKLMRSGVVCHIFEVGYCSDTDSTSKEAEKRDQHKRLEILLMSQGLKVEYHAIPLGRCGTIPACLPTLLKSTLGMDSTSIAGCTRKLHRHAVRFVETMYQARQCVDNPTAGGAPLPNLNPLTRRTGGRKRKGLG